MKPMRMVIAGMATAGAALLAAASSLPSIAAADEPAAAPPPGLPGEGPHHRGHGPEGEGPEHLFGKLNLSADQKASIKDIMTAARPTMKSMHDQMRANHLKIMQTKPDDPNYANVVAEVAQSNAALASQHTTRAAELRTQMYAVLTPPQKAQLAALEAERAANPHHGRWEHGRGEPEPPAAP